MITEDEIKYLVPGAVVEVVKGESTGAVTTVAGARLASGWPLTNKQFCLWTGNLSYWKIISSPAKPAEPEVPPIGSRWRWVTAPEPMMTGRIGETFTVEQLSATHAHYRYENGFVGARHRCYPRPRHPPPRRAEGE